MLLGAQAGAEENAAADPGARSAGGPGVGLDRLLTLPDTFSESKPKRGGASADEWRSRFLKARADLEASQGALEKAKAEMEALAGDTASYQVAAPGSTTPENSPVSFKLRQEIRRQREAVDDRERDLRALAIEADLAEVPETWRKPAMDADPR